MRMEDGTPTFGFDVSALDAPQDTFNVVNGSIDPVFIEMAAACRYLTESKSVLELSEILKGQYGI